MKCRRRNEMQNVTKKQNQENCSVMRTLLPKEQIQGRSKQCTAMNISFNNAI